MDVDMKEAPARMSMIMDVSRVAPMTLCQNVFSVRAPERHAIASEPSAPHAAHSVAVAQPSSMTPNTRATRSKHGMRLADSSSFFLRLISGSGGGIREGLSNAQAAM